MGTQKHNINYVEPGHHGSRLSLGGGPKIWIRYVRVFVDSHTITDIDYITRHVSITNQQVPQTGSRTCGQPRKAPPKQTLEAEID